MHSVVYLWRRTLPFRSPVLGLQDIERERTRGQVWVVDRFQLTFLV
jgi:hypothetical protein